MTPIRINQQDYKKAALDIQRNFDEISKRLLTVSRPLNVSSRVAELMIDSSLAIDGNGRLYVNGDTVLSPILTALSGLTYASGSPLIRMTGASAFILDTATYLTTIPAHTLDGALHTVSGENPGTPSTETNFSFGAVGHFNLTTIACGDFGHYTWTVQDTVSAGHETIAWTPGNVVISCEADVSTVAQVIAAAGGITGTPWAILTQSIAGVFVDPHALPFTGTLGAFPDFTAGTPGYFLKALSATTFGFAPHNLSYNDVHAAPAFVSAAANLFWATPNGASGVPSLRAIVAADIPALSYDASGAAAAAVNGTANTLAMFTATHVVGNSIVTQPTAIALTFTPTAANNLTINHAVSTGYAAIYQITGAEVTRFTSAGQTMYGALATYYRDTDTYINSSASGHLKYLAVTDHVFYVGGCGGQDTFKIASGTIGIKCATTWWTYFQGGVQAADITYTLPAAPPNVNYQYLASTTAGAWSWRTAAQTLGDIGAQATLTNPVTGPGGTGSQYYLPVFTNAGGTTLVKSIVSQNSSATAVYISPTVAGELDLWVANNSVANNALSIIRNGLSTGTSGAYIDNVITSTTFNQYPTSLITANQSILVAGAGASFLFGTENNAEDLIIIAGSNAIERIRVSGTSGQAKFSYPVGINMTASSNNWIDITTSGTTRAISILQTNGGGASAIKCDATSGSGAVGFHFIQRSSGGYGGWFEALNDGTIPFQIKGTATQTANLMQVSRGTDYGYETFVIKGDGNVGISVPVPLYTLHVSGTPYTSNDIRVTAGLADITAVAQGVGGGIAFTGKYNAGGVQTIYGFVKGIKESAVSGEFAGALVLGTTNQNAPYFFERLRIASTGQLTANYYTTAGILHNAVTTGLISSSLIVAADVTNNTLTNTQLANLVAVGTIPMGATYGLTASAITQAAGKLIGIDCTPNNKFVVSNGGNLGLEVDPASYSDGVRVFAYQRGSGPGYKNILLSDGGGGVSIGTVTNYAKLDIGTSQNVALRISSSVTGNTGTVEFINASNYGYGIIGNVSGTGSAGGDVYGLGYSASNNSSFTSVLRWTSGGNVGIGCTPAAGSTLAIGGTNAAVTVAYCDNPTVTDPYTYTPICSRVEFHSAGIVNVTLAAGSLAEGTIIVCTRDNASSYVIVNGHDLSGAHGAAFFIKTHDNGWQCICGA
jgi:hypothetical protein